MGTQRGIRPRNLLAKQCSFEPTSIPKKGDQCAIILKYATAISSLQLILLLRDPDLTIVDPVGMRSKGSHGFCLTALHVMYFGFSWGQLWGRGPKKNIWQNWRWGTCPPKKFYWINFIGDYLDSRFYTVGNLQESPWISFRIRCLIARHDHSLTRSHVELSPYCITWRDGIRQDWYFGEENKNGWIHSESSLNITFIPALVLQRNISIWKLI